MPPPGNPKPNPSDARGGKRFYLASSFALGPRVQRICETLESMGHVVPVQWWDHSAESHKMKADAYITEDQFYASRSVQMTAARDFGGVTVCDVFILVADEEKESKFNGAAVELGFALALGKPCYALGKIERSAMFAHVKRRASIDDVVREVESR